MASKRGRGIVIRLLDNQRRVVTLSLCKICFESMQ